MEKEKKFKLSRRDFLKTSAIGAIGTLGTFSMPAWMSGCASSEDKAPLRAVSYTHLTLPTNSRV